ncbi:MAG TPA: aldo/keto reductase [Bryobacteraceae bacterium]|nr:aldo/keto reductase [Bryobacteraceae bacterium]
MTKRKLGNSSIEVRPLMFGGNVLGWTIDHAAAFKILDAFVDAGFDFIDTADIYSTWVPSHTGGESETILGNWTKQRGNRTKLILATKVGFEMGPGKKGLSRKYILQAAEDSLRRLQTDYIDLYQSHTDDQETPLEETLGAYATLIQQGKVRVIGASNYKADRLEAALAASRDQGLPAYHSLQPLYNLYERAGYEEALEGVCVKHSLGVIPYYSLASGFLTGKYRSEADVAGRPRGGGLKKYFDERGQRILKALDEVAAETESKPASVALAWLIARPSITAPIASATSIEQLQDLVKGADLKLDRAAIEKLNQASA